MKSTAKVSRRSARLLAACGLALIVASCSNKKHGPRSDTRTVVGKGVVSWLVDDVPRDAAPSRSASRLAVVDFDGDGQLDLVRAQADAETEVLLQSQGRLESRQPITETSQSQALAAGDFDSDGDGDLVVAYADGRDVLYVNRQEDGLELRSLPAASTTSKTKHLAFADIMPASPGLEILRLRGDQCELLSRGNLEGKYRVVTRLGPKGAQQLLTAIDVDGDGDLDVVRDDGAKGLLVFENSSGQLTQRGSFFPTFARRVLGIAEFRSADQQAVFVIALGAGGAIALQRQAATWTQTTLTTSETQFVEARDLDGDGRSEILVAGGQELHVLRPLAGARDPSDGEQKSYGLASPVTSIVVADFDKDSRVDVYVGGQLRDTYFYGGPEAAFTQATDREPALAQLGASGIVLAADLDGDAWIDLVQASSSPGKLTWRRNEGFAEYAAEAEILAGVDVVAMLAFDVDADQDNDLILALRGGPLRLLLNQGKGVFDAKDIKTISATPAVEMSAHDLDRDGQHDIVLRTASGDLQFWRNTGKGRFVDASGKLPAPKVEVGAYLLSDLDGDGDLDYVVAHGKRGELSLVEGLSDGAFEQKAQSLPALGLGATRIRSLSTDDGTSLLVARDSIDAGLAWIGASDGERWTDLGEGFSSPVAATIDFVLIDIDEDGDLDLVQGGRDGVSLLEQHASKWIARPRAVASYALGVRRLLRVDDDRDGDVDVLAIGAHSARLRNRSVDVAVPYRPRIGRAIPVDLTLRNRGAERSSLRVFTSFQEIVGGTPGRFGVWGLDPSKQIELRPLEFKGAEGEIRLELEIPNEGTLIGRSFFVQTLNSRASAWRSGPRVGRRIAP